MNFHAHNSFFNILKLFAVVGSISLLSLNFFFLVPQNNAPEYKALRPTVNHTDTSTKDVIISPTVHQTKTKEDDDFLDFFVMGFPKCGITSMMDFFQKVVNETSIIYKQYFPPGKDGKPDRRNIYEYSF